MRFLKRTRTLAIEVRLSNLEQSSERVQKKANDVHEEVRNVAGAVSPLPQQLGAQDKKIANLLAECPIASFCRSMPTASAERSGWILGRSSQRSRRDAPLGTLRSSQPSVSTAAMLPRCS